MNDLLEALEGSAAIVADGAMGTMLQAAGLPAGTAPELWNAERPDILLEIHRAYLRAGAQVATANTFGSNRLRMREAGLAERAAELTRLGVALARRAVGDAAWVAASIGPTGQLLAPYGTLTEAEAEEAYAEQVRAAEEAGADLLLIETQQALEEALCAVAAARKHTHLPIACTFAFDARGRTMMGLRAADAALEAARAGAHLVGANCGAGPEAVGAAIEAMAAATSLPLIAQANAGVPRVGVADATEWDVSPDAHARWGREMVRLGARVVGGCCGTRPEHIAALAAALRTPIANRAE